MLGPDEDACRETVHQVWPNGGVPGQLSQDLPTLTHFEQAAELVAPDDDRRGRAAAGPTSTASSSRSQQFVDAGFDHIYFHQIGPDQDAWFDMWTGGLSDALRAL